MRVILLFPASTVVVIDIYHVLKCTSHNTMSVKRILKQVTLGNSSYFNGGSCYEYNHIGIDYIKLSASIYRNIQTSP